MSLQPRYCHIWLVTHASYSMTTTSNGHRKSSPSSIFAPISVSRPRPRLRLRLTSLASHAPYMRRRSRTLLSWDTKREHPGSIAHPGAYSENVGSELSVWLMVQSRCARRRYLPASCPSPSNSRHTATWCSARCIRWCKPARHSSSSSARIFVHTSFTCALKTFTALCRRLRRRPASRAAAAGVPSLAPSPAASLTTGSGQKSLAMLRSFKSTLSHSPRCASQASSWHLGPQYHTWWHVLQYPPSLVFCRRLVGQVRLQ
mmetsp:Transcript_61302/g.89909  ORF Transcript_61302/g.89909 Transcript_61302/m.89909 type:complete len:259 (+) Transcript_61302:46-822(+)